MKEEFVKISIVFNNLGHSDKLRSLWGFSCFIETPEHKILFDTGSNGRVLLSNIKKSGLNVKNIDFIFLSHPHWDHMGGIDSIQELNNSMKFILTNAFSGNFIRDLQSQSFDVIISEKIPFQLGHNIHSTGVLEDSGEQALLIDTPKGIIIITGCAHAGIKVIMEKAQNILNKDILCVLGGFHLAGIDNEELSNVVDDVMSLKPKYISPSHCSGKNSIELISKRFKDNYISSACGEVIIFD